MVVHDPARGAPLDCELPHRTWLPRFDLAQKWVRNADSEENHEPVSDIDTAAADSLKVLDPKRPIREVDMSGRTIGQLVLIHTTPNPDIACMNWLCCASQPNALKILSFFRCRCDKRIERMYFIRRQMRRSVPDFRSN